MRKTIIFEDSPRRVAGLAALASLLSGSIAAQHASVASQSPTRTVQTVGVATPQHKPNRAQQILDGLRTGTMLSFATAIPRRRRPAPGSVRKSRKPLLSFRQYIHNK